MRATIPEPEKRSAQHKRSFPIYAFIISTSFSMLETNVRLLPKYVIICLFKNSDASSLMSIDIG